MEGVVGTEVRGRAKNLMPSHKRKQEDFDRVALDRQSETVSSRAYPKNMIGEFSMVSAEAPVLGWPESGISVVEKS
jgi:hypothetical protein